MSTANMMTRGRKSTYRSHHTSTLLLGFLSILVYRTCAASHPFIRPSSAARTSVLRNFPKERFSAVKTSTVASRCLLTTRGGASDVEEDSDFSDEEDDDDEGFFDDFDLGDDVEDDFAEDNTVDRMIQAFHKTPPLTKGYLTASFLATACGYVLNKNDFPSILLLDWQKVVTRGQIWRLFTTFFNFGSFGLGYIMTMHFMWTYMSTLERLHHHKPYDFWIMIAFGMLSMVVGYPLMKLNARFLGHNLSTFLVYVWSRYHEGLEVNMFELFNTRAELLPWFFLAQTFLLEGEPPVLDFLGIVFGHVYHHCKTVGLLRAPDSVVQWYQGSDSPFAKAIREKYKQISSDFEMI